WAPAGSSFHEPSNFGVLKLLDAAPRVREAAIAVDYLRGKVGFRAEVAAEVEVRAAWLFGQRGRLQQLQSADIRQGRLNWEAESGRGPAGEGGDFVAVAALSMAGQEVYRAVIPMSVPALIEVTARKYVLATKRVDVEVNAAALASQQKVSAVRVTLVDAAGASAASAEARLDDAWRGQCSIDIKDLPPGTYALRATGLGPTGEAVYSRDADTVTVPPRPAWIGNREGISDQVLPPWTPLRVSGKAIRPWGREYRWGGLPFPQQVISRDAELLAGPIRLVATINGRQQAWMDRSPEFTHKSPARVEFSTYAEGQDASVRGRLWCEYDGCVRSDWEIVPKRQPATLERLVLEIPFRAQHAKLFYHFPGRWGSAFNAGAVPPDGMSLGYRPYIWLGDEWRGLAWFCPSDEAFRIADPNRAVEIKPDGDVVLLRVAIVERPVALEKPFSTTFGFEATPIRPNPQDVWDYRIIHTGNYGLEERTYAPIGLIRWEAQGNISATEGTLEAWVRPHFDPNPPIQPDDPGRGRYNRDFFTLHFGGYTVGFYWNIDDRGMRGYVRTPSGEHPIILGARNNWKTGEWHHIALSWGKEMRVYCDGQLLAKRSWNMLWGTAPENLQGGYFQIGGAGCEMDVDDFCISDVQREPRGHLGPLQPDEHTLILETFDTTKGGAGGEYTVPAVARGGAGHIQGPVPLVDGRFGKAVSFAPGERRPILQAYRELGVRTICFHEHWSSIQNYFAPADPDRLRKLVRACHDQGIRLLVYYGYELSDIAPEWESCRDEILVYPRAGGYHRQPEQHCYICCYNSVWQDYLAWAIARTMDEFDMDGVYLDGTANPFGCANIGHGCGYIGEDGKPHATYPFFAVREMMKRIYTIVKTRKPDGLVNVHQSTCMTIPSVGWATSYWDGEQFGGIDRKPENWPLEILPLEAFRAEFMGHQWGVPAELLCYERPYTFREALAITLPHDVLVRPGESGLELASKIWKAAEMFGRRQARWLPYWENKEYVEVNDDDLKCSLYWREKKGVLVVVSNLGREPVEGRVWLNAAKLGLPAQVEAYDVVDQTTSTCQNGRLSFSLQPLEFKMIWLR
ncbi:MAG: hypothetical protein H5T86_09050, partial [Armatimonadetes bacterium]|nr:hypothetical protein [Armatimonadota bacterium]